MSGFRFKTTDYSALSEELKEIEGTNVNLISSRYKYDYYMYMFKESIIDLSINISVYLLVCMTLIIQSLLLYLDERSKELSVGYMLGISKYKRYLEIFIFNVGSYIAIFVGSRLFDLTMSDRINFILFFGCTEILIELFMIHRFETKKIISSLKGERVG